MTRPQPAAPPGQFCFSADDCHTRAMLGPLHREKAILSLSPSQLLKQLTAPAPSRVTTLVETTQPFLALLRKADVFPTHFCCLPVHHHLVQAAPHNMDCPRTRWP